MRRAQKAPTRANEAFPCFTVHLVGKSAHDSHAFVPLEDLQVDYRGCG